MSHGMTPVRGRVFALTIHRDYRCASAGACCTSGWEIPVEAETAGAIRDAYESGRLSLGRTGLAGSPALASLIRTPEELPVGLAGVLATIAPRGVGNGVTDCALFEREHGGLCALQRQCGHAALPMACRQFPRVTLHDARGTFVSLSHYCPTAASLLARADVPLAIDGAPPAFPRDAELVGLDARSVLPPLLRPGVLMTLRSVSAWERFVVGLCARDDAGVEGLLDRMASAAEALRRWRPADGDFDVVAERILDASARSPSCELPSARHGAARRWVEIAAQCLPATAVRHLRALQPKAEWTDGLERTWRQHGRIVRRYLAARAFGSWLLYQGGGIRSVVRGLLLCVGVLRSALRSQPGHGSAAGGLTEAVRAADLILVHLVDPVTLGRALAGLEGKPLTPADGSGAVPEF